MNDGPGNDNDHPDEPAAGDDDTALEELRREFGDRWVIARMTGGYRATPRGSGGTPIPRYGTTPAELAASIRRIERG
jgi:hypothetical protein